MADNPQSDNYGYRFYLQKDPQSIGHPRLDVVIRLAPTNLHFDPERVDLPVVSRDGTIEMLTVFHPWTGLNHYQVTAGQIMIYDRNRKATRAFCFGGQLDILSSEEHTICSIQSKAPILSQELPGSKEVILADEVEILLAERRAAYPGEEEKFEQKLAKIDPLTLYHTCLNSLRVRFKSLPPGGDSSTQKFIHFIQVESRHLEDTQHLPLQADSLEELV